MTSMKLEAKARLTAASVDLAQCKEFYTKIFKLFAADPSLLKAGTQKVNGAPFRNSMLAFNSEGWSVCGHVCILGSSGSDVDGNPAEQLEQPPAKLKTLAAKAESLLEKEGFKVTKPYKSSVHFVNRLGYVGNGFVCEAVVTGDWSIHKTTGGLSILLCFYSPRSRDGKAILTQMGGAK